jgi:hypothetical protein
MGIVAKLLRMLPNWLYDLAFGNAPHKPRKVEHDAAAYASGSAGNNDAAALGQQDAAAISAACASSASHVAIEIVAQPAPPMPTCWPASTRWPALPCASPTSRRQDGAAPAVAGCPRPVPR